MRILITGADGQVGQDLQRVLLPLGEVIAAGRSQLDLAVPNTLVSTLEGIRPDVIVNAAAYTAVDRAESEPDLAMTVNGVAPGILAATAQDLGALLIHISTDYVFDGEHSHPYQETDAANPLGVYGQTKLQGEIAVRTACVTHCVLRTAWVYGTFGKSNFVKTMLRLGSEREEIRVVTDQIGSPTWSYDLAGAISHLIAHWQPTLAGTYHFTNSGVASWYDFAIAIFEEAKALGFPLQIQRVIPIPSSGYPTPARRPAYSVLCGDKLSALMGTPAPYWRHSLRQMLAELR
jgi:dTDP-4-dehydrorhamnose reductase